MRKRSCTVHSMSTVYQDMLMMNATHRAHFTINVINIISLCMLQLRLLMVPATFLHHRACQLCW